MIYGNTAQGLLEAAAGETYGKTAAGSSFDFAADDWFLPEYASKNDHLTVRKIHIGFSGIQAPAVKLLVKQYAAWRLLSPCLPGCMTFRFSSTMTSRPGP